MDWDGNQEIIRKELSRAEVLVGEMAYEDDFERRLELCIHIQRSIIDVLHMTENMTRHLKRGDSDEDEAERLARPMGSSSHNHDSRGRSLADVHHEHLETI